MTLLRDGPHVGPGRGCVKRPEAAGRAVLISVLLKGRERERAAHVLERLTPRIRSRRPYAAHACPDAVPVREGAGRLVERIGIPRFIRHREAGLERCFVALPARCADAEVFVTQLLHGVGLLGCADGP